MSNSIGREREPGERNRIKMARGGDEEDSMRERRKEREEDNKKNEIRIGKKTVKKTRREE